MTAPIWHGTGRRAGTAGAPTSGFKLPMQGVHDWKVNAPFLGLHRITAGSQGDGRAT